MRQFITILVFLVIKRRNVLQNPIELVNCIFVARVFGVSPDFFLLQKVENDRSSMLCGHRVLFTAWLILLVAESFLMVFIRF